MKGIILAGGAGSRLHPLTLTCGKSLLPVYNKPMIFYPLSMLLDAGVEEIMIISTPEDIPRFKELLNRYRLDISYAVQEFPEGIAEALIIGEEFIDGDNVVLTLGDNIFHGDLNLRKRIEDFKEGAFIFGIGVKDPERYGVIEISMGGKVITLEEKPEKSFSTDAVPGLYIYDHKASAFARTQEPSGRGELEITDLNLRYLGIHQLRAKILDSSVTWFDCGTYDSLLEASQFVQAIEKRTGKSFGEIWV
jgi:glucose-1-phosphate thymidylyltransferase